MNLEEKILEAIIDRDINDYEPHVSIRHASQDCATIAREFALKFAAWINSNLYYRSGNLTTWLQSKNMKITEYTTEQLLEIFEKENEKNKA